MKSMVLVPITSILCLTALGIMALINDIDGTLLAGLGVVIAGLGGFYASKVKSKL